MAKTAHIIRHVFFEDLGSFASVLESHGYHLSYFEAGIDNLLDLNRKPADLLIALGGPMSVNDGLPFIQDELAVLRQRIALGLPTLGICLGSQMLATALGAKVAKNKQLEIGWSTLELHEYPGHEYFKHLYNVAVFHWHQETFELPASALLHASTAICNNQAFSVGKNILGLQFHPEVSESGLATWFSANAGEIEQQDSISLTELSDQTAKYAAQLEHSAKRFLSGWLKAWEEPSK